MSGNVKEWVLTTTTTTGPYEMRGGAYNIASFPAGTPPSAPGLQCDAAVPAPATAVRLPSVGFRCCQTANCPRHGTPSGLTTMTNTKTSLPPLATFVALMLASTVAHAQALRPNIMVIFDTSGSMLHRPGERWLSALRRATAHQPHLPHQERAARRPGAGRHRRGELRPDAFSPGRNHGDGCNCPAGHWNNTGRPTRLPDVDPQRQRNDLRDLVRHRCRAVSDL